MLCYFNRWRWSQGHSGSIILSQVAVGQAFVVEFATLCAECSVYTYYAGECCRAWLIYALASCNARPKHAEVHRLCVLYRLCIKSWQSLRYFTASNARISLQNYLISLESYTGAQSCKDKVARTSKFTSSQLTLYLIRQLCISVQNAIYLVTESSNQAYGSLDLLSNLLLYSRY